MSTPEYLNDLCVCGNVVFDDVYSINAWPEAGTSNLYSSRRESLGGAVNVLRAIEPRDDMSVTVNALVGDDEEGRQAISMLRHMSIIAAGIVHQIPWEGPTARAIILSDVAGGERTSFVNWGRRSPVQLWGCSARWFHLSYLDVSPWDLRQVRDEVEVISADLCLSRPTEEQAQTVLANLPFVDYLFVSSAERWVHDLSRAKTVIHHSRNGTTISKEGSLVVVKNESPLVKGVDVLGAGDMYCAGFIQAMIMGRDLEGAAKEAHENVSRMLTRRLERGY